MSRLGRAASGKAWFSLPTCNGGGISLFSEPYYRKGGVSTHMVINDMWTSPVVGRQEGVVESRAHLKGPELLS